MASPGTSANHAHPPRRSSGLPLQFLLTTIFIIALALGLPHLDHSSFKTSAAATPPTQTPSNIASSPSFQSSEPPTYFAFYILYMNSLFGFFYSRAIPSLFNLVAIMFRWFAHPPLILISISLALLAPIGFFTRLVILAAVQTPVSWLIWAADLLYPIYMFLGVAALTGASLGLCGAGFARGLLLFLSEAWNGYTMEYVDDEPAAYEEEMRLAKLRRRSKGKRRASQRLRMDE